MTMLAPDEAHGSQRSRMQEKVNIAVFVDYDNIEIGVQIDAAT